LVFHDNFALSCLFYIKQKPPAALWPQGVKFFKFTPPLFSATQSCISVKTKNAERKYKKGVVFYIRRAHMRLPKLFMDSMIAHFFGFVKGVPKIFYAF
jgi:hypothetical protein